MLFHWRRWEQFQEEHLKPFVSLCKGCLYLHIYTWNNVDLKTTENNWLISKNLSPNLAHPCREGPLLLMPQSPRETSSHTCRNDGHTAFMTFHLLTWPWAWNAAAHLWHSSPMPSKGCKTPVEDSPWARKNTTGLYFDKALQKRYAY